MSIKRTQLEQSKDRLCKSCMMFFGNQTYKGLCSSCHKKQEIQKKEESLARPAQAAEPLLIQSENKQSLPVEHVIAEQKQKDRKRCYNCSKKLGLLGIECKCGFIFCNSHRLPEQHKCPYDFAAQGLKKLQKEIVKVCHSKIEQI